MSEPGQHIPQFSKPARPQFSKPAAEPARELQVWQPPELDDNFAFEEPELPEKKPRWKKVTKIATTVTAASLVVALGAGGLWVNNLRTDFDDGRQVLKMASHDGNAQPNMEGLVKPTKRSKNVSGEIPSTTQAPPDPEPISPAERVEGGMNILLMGSDMRPEDDVNESRTDTIMVAHISEEWDSVQLLSLPRDLWVQIPGEGEGRINSTFQYGGPPKAVETVESLLQIQIKHAAMIDFNGFADLTTALGGVTIDNPHEFTTYYDDIHYPAGEITLEGEEALHYVRERKSLPHSDLSRVANQQRVVKATASEIISAGTLTSPAKIDSVLDTILQFISVDEDLTATQLAQYALAARNLKPENITSVTAPVGNGFTTSGGAQVLDLDVQGLNELRAAFAKGTLDEYAAAHPAG